MQGGVPDPGAWREGPSTDSMQPPALKPDVTDTFASQEIAVFESPTNLFDDPKAMPSGLRDPNA